MKYNWEWEMTRGIDAPELLDWDNFLCTEEEYEVAEEENRAYEEELEMKKKELEWNEKIRKEAK